MSGEFSHLDEHGHASMVNVTGKAITERRSYVRCVVEQVPNTVASLGGPTVVEAFRNLEGGAPNGDARQISRASSESATSGDLDRGMLEEARSAGLIAAKQTFTLIPLCHPILLSDLDIAFVLTSDSIEVLVRAQTFAQTGVEMEALTACAIAAVSLFGSAREHDPFASVEHLTLWEKSGGRSGLWQRDMNGEIEHLPGGAEDLLGDR